MLVENLSKPNNIPQVQHLKSLGETMEKDEGGKVTQFFNPSMVFPNKVEILSATILHKNKVGSGVKQIKLSKDKDGWLNEDKYILKHKEDKLVSTIKYQTPIIMDPLQPFYFYSEGELDDSCLVIGYRNLDLEF